MNGSGGARVSFCFGVVFCRQFAKYFQYDLCGFAVGLFPALPPPTLCNMQGVCVNGSGGASVSFCSPIFWFLVTLFNMTAVGSVPALPPPPNFVEYANRCV